MERLCACWTAVKRAWFWWLLEAPFSVMLVIYALSMVVACGIVFFVRLYL